MKALLSSIMDFAREMAADSYSQGFTKGVAIGRGRGQQLAMGA